MVLYTRSITIITDFKVVNSKALVYYTINWTVYLYYPYNKCADLDRRRDCLFRALSDPEKTSQTEGSVKQWIKFIGASDQTTLMDISNGWKTDTNQTSTDGCVPLAKQMCVQLKTAQWMFLWGIVQSSREKIRFRLLNEYAKHKTDNHTSVPTCSKAFLISQLYPLFTPVPAVTDMIIW